MINKKNLLGKKPQELGDKDAIHVAIVAVRAGLTVHPGARCGINEHREAVPDDKGVGVADPFLKAPVMRGESFWLLLNQDAVPNVRHVWEHPDVDFTPPEREVVLNDVLNDAAKALGVTYQQLMDACASVVENDEAAAYPGTLSAEDLEEAIDAMYLGDVYSEWGEEVEHEFYNSGTECCPEYDYPRELFAIPEAADTE